MHVAIQFGGKVPRMFVPCLIGSSLCADVTPRITRGRPGMAKRRDFENVTNRFLSDDGCELVRAAPNCFSQRLEKNGERIKVFIIQ